MPFVRSSISKRCALLVSIIILLNKIMPFHSCCVKKKLLYIIIIALSSYQLFFYIKYTKSNMHSSCDV